jgi:hypothetical protein
VTAYWRKLHNEELYDLYCSEDIIRVIKSRIRWACVSIQKPEGMRRLGRLRRRRDDNIKMDLQETVWVDENWVILFQGRDKYQAVVNAVMKLSVA